MARPATVKEVRAALRRNIESRPDLGLWRAVVNAVLEPANPFDPAATRKPQRWFVLAGIVFLGALGAFFYFNCWN
jgi:hypothetical protein